MFSSGSIKLRWINTQCFEIKLSCGKTIITDPFIDIDPEKMPKYAIRCGFTSDDVEGADYIILNHTHGDHVIEVGKLARKFGSLVICHELAAAEVARVFDIPFTRVFPVSFNDSYHFEGFDLATFHGMHRSLPKPPSAGGPKEFGDLGELWSLGSLFNFNFMITTEENLRIGFSAGDYFDDLAEKWKPYRPNIVLRHRLQKDSAAELFTEVLEKTGAQIMLPMHHEDWNNLDPGFIEKVADEVNAKAAKKGLAGRMFVPEQCRWYELSLGIAKLGDQDGKLVE